MTPSMLAIHRVLGPALNSLACPGCGSSLFPQIFTNALMVINRPCCALSLIQPSIRYPRLGMASKPPATQPQPPATTDLWCPTCARAVQDPLVCGDCSAVLCRVCGTPLESADALALSPAFASIKEQKP